MKYILPVIHHSHETLTLEQAQIAFECGCDGVFLISHSGADLVVFQLAQKLKTIYPTKLIGINLLYTNIYVAASLVNDTNLDMLWVDNCYGEQLYINEPSNAKSLINSITSKNIQLFGGVAFKYQPADEDYMTTTAYVRSLGIIPTTSGQATGKAPSLAKIQNMWNASEQTLAVASGLNNDNIEKLIPYISHVLVATGISSDDYHFDYELLSSFVGKIRSYERRASIDSRNYT